MRNAIFNSPLIAEEIEPEISSTTPERTGPFSPKADDVVAVKKFFLERAKLPLELVDAIIDLAEYWPHTRSVFQRLDNPLYVRGGGSDENQLLVSPFTYEKERY